MDGRVPFRHSLPEAPLEIGALQPSRLREHYDRTLATDMLYMMYEPMPEGEELTEMPSGALVPPEVHQDRVRRWAGDSPYFAHRHARPQRGNRPLLPILKPLYESNHVEHDLPRLERVVLTAFCRDAIVNKQALLPLLGQVRAVTGLPVLGSLADPSVGSSHTAADRARNGYIQILRAKKGVASFKLRPGMPVGVQAVLLGDSAYEFIELLTTFVLPRLRGFGGLPLPPAGQPLQSAAAVSGVVSFGMGPEAMPLFPQVEVNLDQYPGRRFGFQIDCITNQPCTDTS
ncbi:hypothetical protein MVES_000939 [Malassezia vespertilionis]|uniref:Large ribosomal subunit protein uL5 C-terminal domain-containing protein n=1 Tax=Malassezia vespertilionis TaxID=2020962 RepID=A0A2N1JDW3_9BASI|nr:hypothetical protein MVES_000939 [Malassezia vespertilionis]